MMNRCALGLVAGAWLAISVPLGAQPQRPFKLGTFSLSGRTFAGAILNDTTVIDLVAADSARRQAGTAALPRDLKQIIARYSEPAVRSRIYALVNAVAGATGARPAYVHDVKALAFLPPVTPRILLNATLNYQEHADELAKNPGSVAGVSVADVQANQKPVGSIAGVWTRKPGDTRQNPYFFSKPTTAIIGHGAAIRIPPGRDQIDAECEMTLVVGRPASRVPVGSAAGIGASRGLFLKPGDVCTCAIEQVGTLRNPVTSAK